MEGAQTQCEAAVVVRNQIIHRIGDLEVDWNFVRIWQKIPHGTFDLEVLTWSSIVGRVPGLLS